MVRTAIALCLLAGTAPPAASDEAFTRPESCERIATAQYDDCSVTNTFRCQDADQPFWVESIDADNFLMIETRNADHGTIKFDYVAEGLSMSLVQSKAHPRDVIRAGTGQDTIVGELTVFGMTRTISGATSYAHAGETVDHSGMVFARINFRQKVTMPYPVPSFEGSGSMLYNAVLDLLVAEDTRFDEGLPSEPVGLSRLSLPGHAGFGEENPQFGCGEYSWNTAISPEDPA